MTYGLHFRTWSMWGQGEPPCQISKSNVIRFKSYCLNTQTHRTNGSTWTTEMASKRTYNFTAAAKIKQHFSVCLMFFSALSLWCCWLGGRKGIRHVKKLSGEILVWLSVWRRCKWSAYGPADATATPSSLALVKSRMVYLSGASLPGCPGKKPLNRCHSSSSVVSDCLIHISQ